MLDSILKIADIIIKAVSMIVKIVDMRREAKEKHQKNNRSR